MKESYVKEVSFMLVAAVAMGITPHYAAAQDAKPETGVYSFRECPATGPNVFAKPGIGASSLLGATIVSAIVSPLIESVVDKGVEALKEAAKDKDIPLPSPVPVIRDFYEVGVAGQTLLNSNIGCIVLVRGVFEVGDYPSSIVDPEIPLPERIASRFRVQGPQPGDPTVRVKPGSLEFYFEIVPVISDNGKVFGFRPQALHVARFASKDGFFGPSKRHYKFTVTFADAFGTEAFASAEFRYEGLENPFSAEACVAKPATEYCPAIELGGIRGWYATKPLSDDLQPVIKKRQTVALTLKTAITSWVEPRARAETADDITAVRTKQDAYCAALDAANASKGEAHQQWDANCSGALLRAKREYLYEQAKEAARLEKQAADAFWREKCVDGNKNELTKTDDNAVSCLRTLVKPERVSAGKFLLTSTIIETRPGNEVAKFLAPAAEKVAPTIKTALKEKLDPLERRKAKEVAEAKSSADAKAHRDAVRAASLADSEAQIAQIEYDKAAAALADKPTDPGLQVASIRAHMSLLKAQAASNDARRTTDLPVLYPGVD